MIHVCSYEAFLSYHARIKEDEQPLDKSLVLYTNFKGLDDGKPHSLTELCKTEKKIANNETPICENITFH